MSSPSRHAEVLLHEDAGEELPRADAHFGLHALAAALDHLQHGPEVVAEDAGSLIKRINSAGTTLSA
jgi:hypothetical protein